LSAVEALEKAPKNVRQTLLEKIFQLAANPASQQNNVKALQGIKGDLRLRVGDYRIIFRVIDDQLHIVAVGPRRDIYGN
jgi:mRNA interferase RelE/StbE